MKFTSAALTALLAGATSAAADSSTNLVVNGSFETNTVKAGTWTTIKATDVEGWEPLTPGASFEFWGRGFGGITPPQGNNIVEIDVHNSKTGTDGLYQVLSTTKNQEYEVSFSIRARRNDIKSASEAVIVEWNGVETSETGYYASAVGEWERVKIIVVGTGSDKLLFRETATTQYNDSLGPLLDDVVVTEYSPKPSDACGKDNMIINCSFEDTKVQKNTYKFFPAGQVLGWKSLNGEPLELWGTL